MAPDPITLTVRLEARDLVREDVYRAFGGIGGLLWLGAVAAGAWLVTEAMRGGGGLSPTVLGLVGGVTFALPFLFLVLVPLGAWRSYTANRSLQVPTALTLDDDGVATASELSQGRLAWAALRAWRESPWAFHLYVGRHLRIVVPKRALASVEELERVRALVQDRVG